MFCGREMQVSKWTTHFRQCKGRNAIRRSQDVELLAKTPRGVVV